MSVFEAAIGARSEPDELRALERVHRAFVAGRSLPAQPRPVIAQSWRRMHRLGVAPHRGLGSPVVSRDDVDDRTRAAWATLRALTPSFRALLGPLLDDGQVLFVLADANGRVCWREGGSRLLGRADGIGFVPGADWTERAVGTNAIGTVIASGRPVQVHAAEHYRVEHHRFTCSGAPIIDPRSGRLLGVIDLTTRVDDASGAAIALAASLAQLARMRLVERHRADLARLERAASFASIGSGPALVVDRWGWVVSSTGASVGRRIVLPEPLRAEQRRKCRGAPDRHVDRGTFVVEGLGLVEALPFDEGWLLRGTAGDDGTRQHIALRVSPFRCEVTIVAGTQEWTHVFVGRRARLLACLAEHPEGMDAEALALAAYGPEGTATAVRAEVHRIRSAVGGLIVPRPYRLADGVELRRTSAA